MSKELFEIRDGVYKTEFTWDLKDDWNSERLRKLALDSTRMDIENQVGAMLAPEVDMQVKEVTNDKGNPALNLITEIKYKYRHYIGVRDGQVVLHKRIIAADVVKADIDGDIINREREAGYAFIQSFLPEAVRRIGCTCCYGDGPDLTSETKKQKDGSYEIVFTVDFNFENTDY